MPSKIFLYNLKAYSNNFIPLQEFGLRGSLFPLKIDTYELNIHSSGNLFLSKISLNVFVKDFQHLSPPTLRKPGGHTCFFSFYTIHCTLYLLNLNSSHCFLYLISINAIIPFIFNIHQLFYMLIPDFLLIFHTFTTPLSSLRQLTLTTSFLSPTLCLEILNSSQPSRHKTTSTTSQAF